MSNRDQTAEEPVFESPAVAGALIRLLRDGSTPADVDLLAGLLDGKPEELLSLCAKNVIGVRALEALEAKGKRLGDAGDSWLERERRRVGSGLEAIASITELFERHDVPFMVIKTGDHYPDQGHDVDLFVEDRRRATDLLRRELGAARQERSFSEVMAAKANLQLGPVTVEVHANRLGQLGEHRRLAREIFDLRRRGQVGPVETWVPSHEGRMILALLQRIYRHFNFRICDVINLAALVESPSLRHELFWRLCRQSGLVDGATLGVAMVSDLLTRLGGQPLQEVGVRLPDPCPFPLSFQRDFYRFALAGVVPRVYLRQFSSSVRRGSALQAALLLLLGLLMAVVGLNIRFLPSMPLWRRLW